jgi:hypothetical protein
VNPVMVCDGCELWHSGNQLVSSLVRVIPEGCLRVDGQEAAETAIDGMQLSQVYTKREDIAEQLGGELKLSKARRQVLVDVIRSRAKCYAGLLGTMRAGHKGYADQFEVPKLFPGRMGKAARWGVPSEEEKLVKPWLERCPRLIFVSDMGDALSRGSTQLFGQFQ